MTETIDKLYLELSNITSARNRRELDLAVMIRRLIRALPEDCKTLSGQAQGLLVRHGLELKPDSFLRSE